MPATIARWSAHGCRWRSKPEIFRGPEEILRLGTYAGTCLGLGGCNALPAVAVLLDANKRVVCARDTAGRVVARQLLAISANWYDDGAQEV